MKRISVYVNRHWDWESSKTGLKMSRYTADCLIPALKKARMIDGPARFDRNKGTVEFRIKKMGSD